MEKSESLVLEIFITHSQISSEGHKVLVQASSVQQFLAAVHPKTFDGAVTTHALSNELLGSSEFWRLLHASIKEDRMVALDHGADANIEAITSLALMNGFTNFRSASSRFVMQKPAFKTGGTLLKKKQEQTANPWAELANAQPGTINEDELMKDVETKLVEVTEKFCGVGDGIKPGKPCDNCTCGLKEIYEASLNGGIAEGVQVESNCGKCYLGDAFRCAGCPFRGQPAFEPGDKVKLQNASVEQITNAKAEQVKTKSEGDKVVLQL